MKFCYPYFDFDPSSNTVGVTFAHLLEATPHFVTTTEVQSAKGIVVHLAGLAWTIIKGLKEAGTFRHIEIIAETN